MDSRANKRKRMDQMAHGSYAGEKVSWDDDWDSPTEHDRASPPIPEFHIPDSDESSENSQQNQLDDCAGQVLSFQKEILWSNPEFRYSLLLFYMNKEEISFQLMKEDHTGFEDVQLDSEFKNWFDSESDGYDDFYENYWINSKKTRKAHLPNVPQNPFTIEHVSIDPNEWKTDELFWINLTFLWSNQVKTWFQIHAPGIKQSDSENVLDAYRFFNHYQDWFEKADQTDDLILSDSFILWLDGDTNHNPPQKRQEFLVFQWQTMNACTPTLGNGIPPKLRAFAAQGIFFYLFF